MSLLFFFFFFQVIGLPRKRNYSGRWEVLIDKCTRCLNKLLEMASSRRRNYILDQVRIPFFFFYDKLLKTFRGLYNDSDDKFIFCRQMCIHRRKDVR